MAIINRGILNSKDAYVRQVGNDWPTAQVLYTQDVLESSSNLYFTNARAISALTNSNLSLNNLTLLGDLEVQGNTVTLNTATLVVEDKNVLLANGATNASQADGAGISVAGAGANIVYEVAGDDWAFNKDIRITGNVIATANLIANGLTIRNITVSDAVLAGNVSGNISGAEVSTSNVFTNRITANIWNGLYTANVIESSGNLYYTNARVNSFVQPFLTTANVVETSSNLYFTNARVNSFVQPFLTTANVTEISSNLYFTTARARDSFTAGENITITNGEISAQIGATVVVNDSTTITAVANTLTYSMGRSITDAKNILVFIEGVTQIPTTDYSVSGSSLILTGQPPVGANIEVRFFGTEAYRTTTPSTLATVNTFTGNGSNTNFTLSVSPPSKSYVTVVIDGVTQLADAYELVGTTLIMTEAPSNGANIDIRMLTGVGTGAFNTRTFTGDGANTNFTITSGFSNDTILVFENGVAQVPVVDYTVSGTTLQFTTAPAPNVVVQIREFGIVPNVSTSITAATAKTFGYSLIFGG